ncbi:MAG: shikimate dehydrogenase [Chloroflexia bacterium]|nr:shikimate dehydrogenase [Chloroflexia bacterium]
MASLPNIGRIGLIGDPVAHSLSPAFQQAAFDVCGIPIRYELLHTPSGELDERMRQLRGGGFSGANVTVPHKEFFFDAVDERSAVAERAGAVNTIICDSGRLYGENTDVFGFAESLRAKDFPFDTSLAIILGAGGAARGVVVALLESDIKRVIVANRTPSRAERLASDLDDPRISICGINESVAIASEACLLINATSIGWNDDQLPIDPIIFSSVDASTLAYDLTYRKTNFLQQAEQHGLQTMDGLAMLVHQGARSFELWTAQPAPVQIMLDAAVTARDSRG